MPVTSPDVELIDIVPEALLQVPPVGKPESVIVAPTQTDDRPEIPVGGASTVTGRVTLQPVEGTVYVIIAIPPAEATPHTIPVDEPTEAIPV